MIPFMSRYKLSNSQPLGFGCGNKRYIQSSSIIAPPPPDLRRINLFPGGHLLLNDVHQDPGEGLERKSSKDHWAAQYSAA